MNLLYPGFLFALFSVAIPMIIHLFNFCKFKKVYFSNISFLKEVNAQTSSKEILKNILILSSRLLAIIFLVLAFSRPFLPSTNKIDQAKNNTFSIYLDNSYSMEAVNTAGSLLDEAKRKAKEIAKSYYLNDKFQLLTNDFEGKHQRLLNADDYEIKSEVRSTDGKSLLYVADQVKKAGFYDVKKGDSILGVTAFNDSRSESDIHYSTVIDLQKLFGKQSINFLDEKTVSLSSAVVAKNNGTELWKLCLILILVL